MKEHSLKKRYIIKLFSSIISGVINALLIAFVPKALGPVTYGQFVYLQDFFMKMLSFLDMGSSIAFFTKLSARHDRKELITFYFLYACFILFILFGFILFMQKVDYLHNLLPDIPEKYIYMGLVFGFLTWFTQIFIKISDAYALTISVELIKIGHKISSLFLLLYFIYYTAFDLNIYFYFHYIALLSFLLIIIYLFIKKNIFINIFNFQFSILSLLKEFINYCHPLVMYSIIGLVSGFFDIWLLQKMAGSEQTGFYGLAYSLAAMCFVFTSSMTPIITREFAKAFEHNDFSRMRKLFYRYIPMFYAIATYFSVFIAIESDTVLAIFTDEKFQGAGVVLMVMALYPIHQTYGQLSGSIFYATGQTKLIRNISFFTQPFGMLMSVVLLYWFDLGAIGLAFKMVFMQWIGTNIQLYFNAKLLRFKMMTFVWHQIYTLILLALLAYISTLIIMFNSDILTFLISGVLYTIFVTILIYIFPQIFATSRDEIHIIMKRVMGVIKK